MPQIDNTDELARITGRSGPSPRLHFVPAAGLEPGRITLDGLADSFGKSDDLTIELVIPICTFVPSRRAGSDQYAGSNERAALAMARH